MHQSKYELAPYAVPGLDGAYYIKDWVTQAEADELVKNVCDV